LFFWALATGGCSAEGGTRAVSAVDLFVDSGAQTLAAYQLDFSAPDESVKIVSIKGGHPAFKEPPYYDPKAIQTSGRSSPRSTPVPPANCPPAERVTVHVR
jgi:hypothetical protein